MGRFISLCFSLLVVFLSLSGAKGSTCPFNWLPMYGLCYKVFNELKTWDDAEGYSWEWTDGSSTDYQPWKQSQPNHYLNKEFCVEIVYFTGYRLWNDQDCKVKNAFLCQCRF